MSFNYRVLFPFAAVLAVMVLPSGGYSAETVNGVSKVVGHLSPLAFPVSIAAWLFLLFRGRLVDPVDDSGTVFVWKRFSAILIDGLYPVFLLVPWLVTPFLFIEADATGQFAWSFERNYRRSSDLWIFFAQLPLVAALLFYYVYLHLLKDRQTIGQLAMGYRIVFEPDPSGKTSKQRKRMHLFLSYIGLCTWPISLWLASQRDDKAFWWEWQTSARAVPVT